MNCAEDISKFFKDKIFNYHFDDNVKFGKRQSNTSKIDYTDRYKILIYGNLINDDDIKMLSVGLPMKFDLKNFIGEVHDQSNEDIAVSCAISAAISIRTNYINWTRYRVTRWILGNKFKPIKPNKRYIYWNARVQSLNNAISPSIASHLVSILSHKIVDSDKYIDDINYINKEPDLIAFYHASKISNFDWFKLKPDLITFKLILNKGYSIIAGIVLYPQVLDIISYQFGIIKYPEESSKSCGSQPILIIGYNDDKKEFIFLNSWGKQWGEEGCGTIGYDYIMNKNLAGDFCVITYEGY